MEPDIRFFQAAATIIPTLLVAIVFSTQFLQPRESEEARGDRVVLRVRLRLASPWFALRMLLVLTLVGEVAALNALLLDRPTIVRAVEVYAAVGSELLILAVAMVRPHLERMRSRRGMLVELATLALLFGWLVLRFGV
jgi:hypothetical protein